MLNINADTVAAAIGGALSAEKLVLCTGAPGILERSTDTSSLISYTDIKGLGRPARCGQPHGRHAAESLGDRDAIRGGVRRVHVITYKSPDSLLAEIFTNEGTGHPGGAGLDCSQSRRATELDRPHDAACGTRVRRSMSACSRTPPARTISLDERLVRYDIEASIAHADMLARTGLLSAADHAAIRDALRAIGAEHAEGRWRITLEEEDCQTAIENRLTERIGAAGGRLHAGRSRNDQVLAALRLYLREATQALHAGALAVAEALEELAARDGAIALPGYTHMQQAMPSTVALWALGFARRDPRRCRGPAARAAAREQESAGLGGRIRHAESRHRPRSRRARVSASP